MHHFPDHFFLFYLHFNGTKQIRSSDKDLLMSVTPPFQLNQSDRPSPKREYSRFHHCAYRIRMIIVCYRQDFHWKLMSLYVDNRLAEEYFCRQQLPQAIGSKQKGICLFNIERYTQFITNYRSGSLHRKKTLQMPLRSQ